MSLLAELIFHFFFKISSQEKRPDRWAGLVYVTAGPSFDDDWNICRRFESIFLLFSIEPTHKKKKK
jgi:hypothetical protein